MSDKKPKLTVKQAKFVKAKAEGKSGTEAAMIAYDVKDSRVASVIAAENLAKPSIQHAMEIAMEKQGITIEKLAETLSNGLDAQAFIKTERVEGIGKNRLKTEEVIPVPDLNTRHKYLETTLKLTGLAQKADTTVNINFNQVANQDKDEFGI